MLCCAMFTIIAMTSGWRKKVCHCWDNYITSTATSCAIKGYCSSITIIGLIRFCGISFRYMGSIWTTKCWISSTKTGGRWCGGTKTFLFLTSFAWFTLEQKHCCCIEETYNIPLLESMGVMKNWTNLDKLENKRNWLCSFSINASIETLISNFYRGEIISRQWGIS